MAILGVVADDLTGANTAAALLTNSSFKALTTIDHYDITQFPFDKYDAIVVNAASRTLEAEAAYDRVKASTKVLWQQGIRCFSKRIDSTIRGNLGAETEGMLAALPSETVACVVAVFPTSGRMVVGGCQIVKGVPVHKTMAGADPVKPVLSSSLASEFKRQTKLSIGNISIDTVANGGAELRQAIESQIKAGTKILIFDAISVADVNGVAEAMYELKHPWIAVDPGPLTQRMCELEAQDRPRVAIHPKKKGHFFIVAGSASDLTNTQMKYLNNHTDAKIVTVDIRPFIESDEPHPLEAIITKRIRVLSSLSNIIGIKAAGYADMMIDINAEAAKRQVSTDCITGRITHALARIVHAVLESDDAPEFDGIYLTGGDMTVAFCQECKVKALELYGEIQPHISYGKFIGGIADGLPLVTKGGMIGDADTIIQCIDFMKSH